MQRWLNSSWSKRLYVITEEHLYNGEDGEILVKKSPRWTFELLEGEQFQFFAFESISGEFTSIEAFDPGNGLAWDFSRLNTEGVLLLTAIPEPSTYAALVGAVLLGLLATRQARRKA